MLDAPQRLSAPDVLPVVEHTCAASIGLALFGPGDHDRDAVLQRADEAMYEVKALRRAQR